MTPQPIHLYCMGLQDRSDRVRWLLEELGVPYVDHFLKRKQGELNAESYRRLNPMGRVPTIDDGGTVMHESGAICLYLADKFLAKGLAPRLDSPERAEYLQWMVFSVASLECVVARMFALKGKTEEQVAYELDFVRRQCEILKLALNPVLSRRDYLLPSGFSAADIMMGAVIPGAFDDLMKENPPIMNYMERLMARPAAIKVKVFEPPVMD
jgi:glutathione S-transferase